MNIKSQLKLPFDQYSRQIQALKLIDSLRINGQSFKILDVGGYKGVTGALHSKDKVTVLDIFDVDEPNYVKGDALDMDFTDESFDFVVSFDVFEHIADKDRKRFVSEIARVAKNAVVIAAPVRTTENEHSEKLLNGLFKQVQGVDHPWLIEHIENGIPTYTQAENELQENKLHTLVLPSNDIRLWVAMQSVIFLGSKYPELSSQIDNLNDHYNKLGPFDGAIALHENYRHIVFGAKQQKTVELIKSSIPMRNFSLASQIDVQEAITQAYAGALKDMSDEREKLVTKVSGLDHACKVLSDQIHKLQHENDILRDTKTYKLTKKIGGASESFKRNLRRK